MELKFIGTASGRTQPDRFHTSILLRNNTKFILIDAGDGVSKALLNQNINFNAITDIILSHYHSDHIAGLTSLITQMIIGKRKDPLNIITHKDLIIILNSFLKSNYIFIEKLKFIVNILGFEFQQQISIDNNIGFIPRQNSHVLNKYGIEDNEFFFASSSFLFQIGDIKIIYTSDIGSKSDLYLFNDFKPDIFISECTHIAYSEIEKAQIFYCPKKFYITHIDDTESLESWHNNLPKNKKENFVITFDGMSIRL